MSNSKDCFGNYENNNNSWHCLGCILEDECKVEKQKRNYANQFSGRPDKDTYYLDIALAVAKRSTCLRRRYGAVIVKDDVIIATGYNGSPRGEVNCCDCGICKRADKPRGEGYELCPAVHAEQNALLTVDRAHSQGATLYLACEERYIAADFESLKLKYGEWVEDRSPESCYLCNRMMKNAGIKRVVTRAGGHTWD